MASSIIVEVKNLVSDLKSSFSSEKVKLRNFCGSGIVPFFKNLSSCQESLIYQYFLEAGPATAHLCLSKVRLEIEVSAGARYAHPLEIRLPVLP